MSVDGSHIDPEQCGGNAEPEQCGGNAAPYVLGALTEQEHEAFRRHVDSCAVCREEVAALQVVAAALPSAAPQVNAPPELKRRVMASVREDARRREADAAGAAASVAAADTPARSRRAARGSRPARRPAFAGSFRWQPGLAVAGLAAAVIALAVVALSGGSGGGSAARVIRAQVLVPRASASLNVSGGHAELDISNMPQAGAGRVYEVWREQSGTPHPTDALFTVSSSGHATVGVPGGVKGVQEVLVTAEPQGGTQVPTNPPVIVARVS
jgi:hypothetical protein